MGHAFRDMPKQLLPLRHFAQTPHLARTLLQLRHRMPTWRPISCSTHSIELVTWDHVFAATPQHVGWAKDGVRVTQLAAPGNSSLKGIARFLEQHRDRATR